MYDMNMYPSKFLVLGRVMWLAKGQQVDGKWKEEMHALNPEYEEWVHKSIRSMFSPTC